MTQNSATVAAINLLASESLSARLAAASRLPLLRRGRPERSRRRTPREATAAGNAVTNGRRPRTAIGTR